MKQQLKLTFVPLFAIMLFNKLRHKAKLKLLQFTEWGNNKFFRAGILPFGRRKMKKLYSLSVTESALWFAPAQAADTTLSDLSTSSANLHALKVYGEIAIIRADIL
jgi:hypothetical protein